MAKKLKLQRRLAADILGCGKKKVWMDPQETGDLAFAQTKRAIRKFVKNRVIVKKAAVGVSRFRFRRRQEAKRKGRHMGIGKRRGTKNARMPEKVLWMRRMRVLRRLLKKYRDGGIIDRHMYHRFRARAKGNQFKSKRHIIETIHFAKNQSIKEKSLQEQAEARKARAMAIRAKKEAKKAAMGF
ncbi:MAG: hypothetical protein KVP17_002463 [Porospora cf. gigantea B]|uniref:uncharacterized protein n=1 Tax=Porospora cf. gigantea A TaxID=2853593 RepID=UPI00355A7586|nr:MAG: hypothetical protein KVP17_002463 [Porospora cf. gigantea B]KAH0478670.1 MAG: hypothetical protein KVP18_004074 [Porospora cf. gigantea A]